MPCGRRARTIDSLEGRAMIPYQLDPTLHATQPVPAQLEDGFSPPAASAHAQPPQHVQQAHEAAPGLSQPVDPALWAKSDF